MKKIFLLTFCLLIIPKFAFAYDCSAVGGKRINSSGFVYFDGQKGKFIKGFEIEDPANKIIMIFNFGGWGSKKKDKGFCFQKEEVEGVLGQLSGRKVKGKEIVVWANQELWKAGNTMGITTKCAMKHKYKGKMLGHTPPWYECVWGPPTYLKKVKTSKKDILQIPPYVSNFAYKNRAALNTAIADIFVQKGTPRNQLFISGHSCGGMGSLRMESLYPDVFNSAIALMPNCWDKSEHSQLRKWELDEIRSAKKIDALIFHSETDGEIDYQSDSRYLKWMADIPGAKWIELPNHNSEDGKEIIIDGKQCKIKKRMRGGWKIKHNQDLGHKKKAWTVVNPEEKKEMLKKARGHDIPYKSCFTPYLDDIEKFIESKI